MEKNEKEDEFVCRTYGKSELAQLYCPDIEPKTAVAKLNQWIALKPGLKPWRIRGCNIVQSNIRLRK